MKAFRLVLFLSSLQSFDHNYGPIYNNMYMHRRTGKILLGGLNIICPNETCWSQMHKMIRSGRQVFIAIP